MKTFQINTDSKNLYKRSLDVAPGGVHSPVRGFQGVGLEPVFFKSAEGAYLKSVEGEEYIDFCQSFGPLILGHKDSDIKSAVEDMLDTLWTSGTCEPYSLELAEWIKEHSPVVEKLRFVSSGTEAVMSALRVARGATGKNKVIKFEGCYHGHVDSLLVKSGSGLAGLAASDSAGVSKALAEQTIVLPLDDEELFKKCIDEHKEDLAAVILEPLPANFGLLIQREEFLKSITEYAQGQGVLVIFDEVISGFRIGFGGMAEKLNLRPDSVTYGKVLGGGLPVGCYGGRKDLMDLVAPLGPVYQAGTLSASPLGMAAGLTQLRKMKELGIHEVLQKRTEHFVENLNRELEKNHLRQRFVSYGSLFWMSDFSEKKEIRKVSDILPAHKEFFSCFYKYLLEEKVFFAPNGFEVGFIGATHTDEILNEAALRILAALQKASKEFYV